MCLEVTVTHIYHVCNSYYIPRLALILLEIQLSVYLSLYLSLSLSAWPYDLEGLSHIYIYPYMKWKIKFMFHIYIYIPYISIYIGSKPPTSDCCFPTLFSNRFKDQIIQRTARLATAAPSVAPAPDAWDSQRHREGLSGPSRNLAGIVCV